MGNYKWTDHSDSSEDPYVVVLMISRNKDNPTVPEFKERRKSVFMRRNRERMDKMFRHFVEDGVTGEFSRMYVSLNARDPEKVRNALMHRLIDDNCDFEYLNAIVAGLAATKECAAEKQWFFDFDAHDTDVLQQFVADVKSESNGLEAESVETPHGYAVIVPHGFDTRSLLKKWGNIASLKRDDLICVAWNTTERGNCQ